ncbi:MAG: type IV pilus secretin PilQ [Neisseriaceae bacterium]|nr:type IV pilus secretin PilQ [Neisseriaceae bacterium]
MKNVAVKALSGLGLSVLMASAWAGTIQDIKVTNVDNNRKIVKIYFQGGAVVPQGFMTDTPPQVALDFADTNLGVQQNALQYNDSLLKGISAASQDSRTRVALALNKKGQYQVERKGPNEIWVHLNGSGAPVSARANDARYNPVNVSVSKEQNQRAINEFAKAGDSKQPVNVEMKFSKNAKGAGVMEFTVPAKHSEPKIERSEGSITLVFPDIRLSPSAQKNYDVAEFATPVRKVALQRVGSNTRITINNYGTDWDYSVKDNAGVYTVSVSPKGDLFNSLDELPKPKSFKGGRVTLDFQDVDVRTILQIIARESGMNIVASDTVQGKMTLNLRDVPWDQALDLVMQARNLDMRRNGSVINIAPRQELLNQDKAIMQGQRELNEMGPLLSRTFQLKYKSVEDFRTVLKSVEGGLSSSSGGSNTILSARGSVMFDAGTNTLIVTDVQSVVNKFEKLIAQLDVPIRQVMVEARIVEANEGFSRELGTRWGFGLMDNYTGTGTERTKTALASGIDGGDKDGLQWGPSIERDPNTGAITSRNWGTNPNINLPVSAATTLVSLYRATAHGYIGLELSAMQEDNRGKVVSSPRVLTQDRKEASLSDGEDVPYQVASSSGATSIQWTQAVTGLKVTPQITPDGNVIMTLRVMKNSISRYTPNGDPVIAKKEVETTAMVENGGTMVVGGIYVEENTNDNGKVPVLGDIPLLGNLFKHSTRNNRRRELLIFVTPRIIDTMNTGSLDY